MTSTNPDMAHLEALEEENRRLREALEAVNRLTSPGTRTFDGMIRDTGLACDIARAALQKEAQS